MNEQNSGHAGMIKAKPGIYENEEPYGESTERHEYLRMVPTIRKIECLRKESMEERYQPGKLRSRRAMSK